MSKADQLIPLIRASLDEILDKHLRQHKIWHEKFFTAIEGEKDPEIRWKMLEAWIDQMPHASFGFTTYVSFLAARSTDHEVRALLTQNLYEEHTSPQSHFKMISGLKGKVQGIATDYKPDFQSLLPTSRAHVSKHTEVARDGDYFEGLGLLLLIENLTAEEFRRVREACANTWRELGKQPENFFNGGGGEGYFRANEDADAGHGLDMMLMVQAAIKAEIGEKINDPAAIKPYLERITRGVITSITCRNAFVEGVHEAVERELSGIPRQGQREEKKHLRIPRPPGQPYFVTILPNHLIEVARQGNVMTFQLLATPTNIRDQETTFDYSVLPNPWVSLKDGGDGKRIDVHDCTNDIAAVIRDFTIVAKNADLSLGVKKAFAQFEKQIPVREPV